MALPFPVPIAPDLLHALFVQMKTQNKPSTSSLMEGCDTTACALVGNIYFSQNINILKNIVYSRHDKKW